MESRHGRAWNGTAQRMTKPAFSCSRSSKPSAAVKARANSGGARCAPPLLLRLVNTTRKKVFEGVDGVPATLLGRTTPLALIVLSAEWAGRLESCATRP